MAKYCRNKGKQGNLTKIINQANITEVDHLINEVSEMNFSCVISEVNLINNPKYWWVDTNATRYVWCKNMMFYTYKEVDGENLYMRNSSTSKVWKSTMQWVWVCNGVGYNDLHMLFSVLY